jgi:tetratricopeptide (TPR) repeat protein
MSARDRRRSAPPRPARAAAPAPPPPPPPAPPVLRDPWAWATLLGVLPLLAKCVGAPLGEPVAEDFDFLHRSMFHGLGSLFDGGGSQAFWRPLAHQVYYALLGPLVLAHPLAVGLLHAALLALGAWLLYRVFRTGLPGPVAAMAASFPLMAESTRTIVGWPTQFVDCGLFVFSALALHEASRRRLPTALAALLAALLCKEIAIVTALLLPLLPLTWRRLERVRWGVAVAALVAAWAAVYLYVRHAAHLELPHGLERGADAAGPLARAAWAFGGSLKALASLPRVADPKDLPALLAGAGGAFVFSAAARARLVVQRGWIAWGLAWFVVATTTLTPIYPLWQPNRSQVGSLGLGAALAPALAAAHPALAVGMVGVRLALLAAAPAPAQITSGDASETGAFMDFAQLTRLQHFMRLTRTALRAAHPTLPHGACVLLDGMPHRLIYSFGGDQSLQEWYADSTLHLLTFENLHQRPGLPYAAVVQYQSQASPEIVVLPVEAIRVQEEGFAALRAQRFEEAIASFARSDSLWRDPHAVVFHASNVGLTAFALGTSGHGAQAEPLARTALAIYPHNENARFVIATEAARRGDYDMANGQLDSLLADNPRRPSALQLRAAIAGMRTAGPR